MSDGVWIADKERFAKVHVKVSTDKKGLNGLIQTATERHGPIMITNSFIQKAKYMV